MERDDTRSSTRSGRQRQRGDSSDEEKQLPIPRNLEGVSHRPTFTGTQVSQIAQISNQAAQLKLAKEKQKGRGESAEEANVQSEDESYGSDKSEGSNSEDNDTPPPVQEGHNWTRQLSLGPLISAGSEKNGEKLVFVLRDYSSFVLAIHINHMPNTITPEEEHTALKDTLPSLGIPAAQVLATGLFDYQVKKEIRTCPAMIMKRYQTTSKRIATSKGRAKDWEEVGKSVLVKERSLASIRNLQSLLKKRGIVIGDLQFLIDEHGDFFVNDPNGIWAKHVPKDTRNSDTKAGEAEAQNNENVFLNLIETIQTLNDELDEDKGSTSIIEDDQPEQIDMEELEDRFNAAKRANNKKLTQNVLRELEEALEATSNEADLSKINGWITELK